MACDDKFRVYSSPILNGVGSATIITTTSEAPTIAKAIYGESFVFLERFDEALSFEQVSAAIEIPLEFREDKLNEFCGIFEDVMLNEGKSIVLKTLRLSYSESMSLEFGQRLFVEPVESDPKAIIRLIIRNRFPEDMEIVASQTRSTSLREFINKHMSIPKIVYYPDGVHS